MLTDAGAAKLRQARATHLAGVRRLFLAGFGGDDLLQLAAYWDSWCRAPPARTRSGGAQRRAARRSSVPDVVVVGAGVSGLCCARELHAAGLEVLVLERGDRPGGRVRTDDVDGFLLDRGFQVLLTAYPEAQRTLDYERLGLRAFESGALVRKDGRFARLADPTRHPFQALESLRSAPGSVPDKLRVARLRRRLSGGSINEILTAPQVTTAQALGREGFSPA